MNYSQFVAQTDIEIGDEVLFHGFPSFALGAKQWFVKDIRAIHYVSSGSVEFEFQLMSDNRIITTWLKRYQIVYPVPKGGGSI